MNRAILAIGAAIFSACVIFAQPAADAPSFEVASVKPSAPPDGGRIRIGIAGGPGSNDPGRINFNFINLKTILARAYEVKPYQISGPGWLETERFDIIAKLPDGASKEQVPLMLQTLLRDRFKLTLHREKKDLPMYALLVGKNGHKLKESQDDGDAPAAGATPRFAPPPPPPPPPPGGPSFTGRDNFPPVQPGRRGTMMMMMPGRARLTANKYAIATLADMLSVQLDRPVVDLTELKGFYDFTLEYAPEGRMPGPFGGAMPSLPPGGPEGGPPIASTPDGQSAPSIFTALQEQIGLRLDSRRGPVDLLVVDHVEKVPTEN